MRCFRNLQHKFVQTSHTFSYCCHLCRNMSSKSSFTFPKTNIAISLPPGLKEEQVLAFRPLKV